MKYDWSHTEAWGKAGAALIAGTLLTVAFYYFCGAILPDAGYVGVAVGVLVGFPVWVASACYAVLARNTVKAWVVLLLLAALLGAGSVVA